MKYALIFLVVISLLAGACKNNRQKANEEVTDSLSTVLKIRQEDSVAIVRAGKQKWIANALQQPNMDWQHLKLHEHYKNDSLEPEPIAPEPVFFENFESVLRYSPDSTYALDIGSYG